MRISSCTIIGAGGTGQQLIPSLMRMLQYHPMGTNDITVFDGDEFESHNGERQVHTSGNKADRFNDLLKLQLLEPVCKSRYMTKTLLERIRQSDTNASGARLLVGAVDNDATRKMCIKVLQDTSGDFLFVTPGNSDAADADKAIKGNVLWFGRIDGQDIGIDPSILFPNIDNPQDGIPRKGSCLDNAPSTPQLIAANALAAAYTLTVVQNFLDDKMPTEASHLFFNGRNFQLTAN
tara:strand:+ start:49 stop:753 length:705 start_codon:yes stop_codon:yes gene_type:complete